MMPAMSALASVIDDCPSCLTLAGNITVVESTPRYDVVRCNDCDRETVVTIELPTPHD